mmetsp:Transcript_366/g.833  ORF Transcript_366/g.833 Transcript_366/m.833 type:complete len:261 (+) Transcript_366:73-855(+)
MGRWVLVPALAGVALTLAGCGSSGDKKKDKVNNNPPDFVSQSLQGKMDAQIQMDTQKFHPVGDVSVFLDADEVNLRVDISVTDNSTPGTASMILNATQKLATLYAKNEIGVLKFRGCRTVDLSRVPLSAQDLRAIIKAKMQKQKPDGMDGALRKFSMMVPPMLGWSAQLAGEFDDANVLNKASASISGSTDNKTDTISGTFSADKAAGGSPDMASFQVPKEWAPCTPIALEENDMPLQVLLKTVFLGDKAQQAPQTAVVV